jgi:hypothetical protein
MGKLRAGRPDETSETYYSYLGRPANGSQAVARTLVQMNF